MVTTELSGYDGAGEPVVSDAVIGGLTGYHFVGGVLRYIYDSFHKTDNGYDLRVGSTEGMLYVVAWEGNGRPYAQPSLGMDEAEWLDMSVAGGEMFLSGSAKLSTAMQVGLKRGMARFDLVVEVTDETMIRSALIKNARQEGWLFAKDGLPPVPEGTVADVSLEPHAYIHEQANPDIIVAVDAVIGGREYQLESPLPSAIVRNTRYTVTLRKDQQTQKVALQVAPWGDGGTADAAPDRSGTLTFDAGRSSLPAGVTLSDDGRTLVLPHTPVDFTVYMACDEQLELVSAAGYLLDVTPVPSDNAAGINAFNVSKRLYAPGVAGGDVVAQFRRKGLSNIYPYDNVTIRLSPNPAVVEGPMNFDNDAYLHDFAGYVDNELGVFTLPAGSDLSVEFADGEDPWLRLDAMGGGRWRVTGGWRPNDPTANGRRQEALLVISNGVTREEYAVVRRNYGLPVTWLHGTWWCKYNAMGRSTSFDDQILSSDDPAAAAGMTLHEYLTSCAPDDYRRLWQWAYQGGSGKGMRVVEQDGLLVMDGFSMDVAEHINKLPSDALAPEGYELPSMDDFNAVFDATDYIWLMWNGTHTLKNPWNGHSLIKREQRRKNDVTVDGMTISDLIYIAMWSPDYPEHEPVVWYGPGAQWNADGIRHAGHYNNILFGVHSVEGSGWYMAGAMNAFYLHKNGAGNRDTRILRFKKSPVDYIY